MYDERKIRAIIPDNGPALERGCPFSAYIFRIIIPIFKIFRSHAEISVLALIHSRPRRAGGEAGNQHGEHEADAYKSIANDAFCHLFSPFLTPGRARMRFASCTQLYSFALPLAIGAVSILNRRVWAKAAPGTADEAGKSIFTIIPGLLPRRQYGKLPGV